METAVIYVTILGIISGATGQQVDMEPVVFFYPGQTVNLSCVFTDATGIHISQVTWLYQSKEGERISIAAFAPNIDPNYPDSPVKGRVSFSPSPPTPTSPSIQIRDVRTNDEGNYICRYATIPNSNMQNITFLDMLEQVGNVTVTASSTDLVEFNSSVSLSCSSSGSSLSFLWLNGSSEVTTSDRVQLTDGNTTLTIVSVTRYDQGPFRCHVFNAVSDGTSAPVLLSISSPVSNVTVTASSTDPVESSSVRLSCSSSGSSLSFLWLNGSSEVTASDRVQLTDGGSTLTIVNVTRYDQGPFRCHVFSPVNNGTSDPVLLSISYGPENVEITGPTKSELEQTIILICSAESTPPANYTWILNGKEILRDSAILIKTMRTSSDGELYICQARNYVTGRTSSGEHRLFVKELGGLSAGAIAGIVVSCLLGTGGALGGGFYIYKTKFKSSAHSHKTDQEENVYENTI